MAFELAYPEGPVLAAALTVAIHTWNERLANPDLESLHAETRIQIGMAESMLARLNAPGPEAAEEMMIRLQES